jgi:hypothetical protein
MKISQTYRPVFFATHTINSAPQEPRSALRGLMQRLGLALLACTLVIGAIGSASAGEAQDEVAVRALGDTFAKAFVQKNAELRASLFAENRRATATDTNVQVRGVLPNVLAIRRNIRIAQGRMLEPGLAELIVGKNAERTPVTATLA